MANLSWKSSTLLGTVLVVALGLQVGAVKILLNRNRPADTAATTPARAPLDKLASATANSERPVVTDPPPSEAALLTSAQQPAPATTAETAPTAAITTQGEASPEARLATTAAPASHSAVRPAVAPKNPPPPTATASVEAAPRPAPASPSSAPAVATAPVPAPVVTPSAEATTIKPDDAPSDGLRDAAWLKTRDPKNYTVQLYSGKDLNKLKEIAAETTSNAPQAYFTTGSRNSPWYSLVVGDYPDSAAARAAAAAIAAQSVQLKPWVRRLDEIQATMR